MFVLTVNKDSWKKVLAALGCAVILCGVILGISGLVRTAQSATAAAVGNTVKSTEDMVNYLLGYGVEVNPGSAQVLQVTIPKKFDKSFKAFNDVLGECGMDLTKFKGKMVEKWVFESPNRTVESQTAYAVLLVRNSKVIGGYLLYQPSGEVISLKDTLDITTLMPQPDEDEDVIAGTGAAQQEAGTDAAAGDAAPTAETTEPADSEVDVQDSTAEETAAGAEGEGDGFPTD